MTDTGPGTLDGAVGVAVRDGDTIADIELQDDRVQEYIEVPRPGSPDVGRKPGRIRGEVRIRFTQVLDAGLSEQLGRRAAQERSPDEIVVDVELDDGRLLPGSRVGSYWGAGPGPIGTSWFSLDLP